MRSKKEKFIELAEKRVNNALKQIQLIGNLSNKRNYEYREEDYRKIFIAIDKEVKLMKQRFLSSDTDENTKFKLRK